MNFPVYLEQSLGVFPKIVSFKAALLRPAKRHITNLSLARIPLRYNSIEDTDQVLSPFRLDMLYLFDESNLHVLLLVPKLACFPPEANC